MVEALCNANLLNTWHRKNLWPHAVAAYTRGYVWYTNCYLIYTGPMILQLNKIKQVEDQWVMISIDAWFLKDTWYYACVGFVKLKIESFDILLQLVNVMPFRLFWLSCLYLVFIPQGNNYSSIKLISAFTPQLVYIPLGHS